MTDKLTVECLTEDLNIPVLACQATVAVDGALTEFVPWDTDYRSLLLHLCYHTCAC